jgi:hypothetical protein
MGAIGFHKYWNLLQLRSCTTNNDIDRPYLSGVSILTKLVGWKDQNRQHLFEQQDCNVTAAKQLRGGAANHQMTNTAVSVSPICNYLQQ